MIIHQKYIIFDGVSQLKIEYEDDNMGASSERVSITVVEDGKASNIAVKIEELRHILGKVGRT